MKSVTKIVNSESVLQRVGWFFGKHVQTFPRDIKKFNNLDFIITKSILPGHIPTSPIFNKTSKLLCVGSCFAQHLNAFLTKKNLSANTLWVPSGFNNTYALNQFIFWVFTGDAGTQAYWYNGDSTAKLWQPEKERAEYLAFFKKIDGFVFTLGLSEVWFDKQTGKAFWRGIPEKIYNPKRHRNEQTSVEQNEKNILDIITMLNEHCNKPIILTLSPVPLSATFRNISCITADCVSKSVLRVAIDNVMNMHLKNVYYWPSFEMIKWIAGQLSYAVYGEKGTANHVKLSLVSTVIDHFINCFYEKGSIL